MSQTKKQKERERIAGLCESMVGDNDSSKQLRAINRRVEKRKREQFRRR